MTETRLQEILYPLAFKGAGKVNTEDALNAMKQAVNEAIQECADKADTKWIEPRNPYMEPGEIVVDKQSILNLKIK